MYPSRTAERDLRITSGSTSPRTRFRGAELSLHAGPTAPARCTLAKRQFTIGRNPICDLVIADDRISGIHCEIITCADRFLLRDLDSRHGTRIHGVNVREAWLDDGIEMELGTSRLRFSKLDSHYEIPLSRRERFDQLIGRSLAMREVFAALEQSAGSDDALFLLGEGGTGKQLAARAVHAASRRAKGPFVLHDCSMVAASIMQSTLFGHEPGAFTGAKKRHHGCLEQATNGTLFIEEIGELDLETQRRLLETLETSTIRREGARESIRIHTRLIATSRSDLRASVDRGQFLEGLYLRLCKSPITLPALRQRPEDIPMLVDHLLAQIAADQASKQVVRYYVSDAAMAKLRAYPWPGNVRELKNTIERAIAIADGPELGVTELTPMSRKSPVLSLSGDAVERLLAEGLTFKQAKQRILEKFEAIYLRNLLDRHEGNITRCAQAAGLTRYHFRELAKRHRVNRS